MLEADQKPVGILNELIIINNDRLEGYNYASRETDVEILKILFSRLTETSVLCIKQLAGEVYKLGGEPVEEGRPKEEMAKAWEEVRTALVKKDHLTLLKSCDKEEEVIIKSYENILSQEEDHVTRQHQQLFTKQYDLLHADRNKVKNLLNVLLKTG